MMKKLLSGFILAGMLAANIAAHATPISGSSVTVSALTPGTSQTRLGKAEDAQHASGDVGVSILCRIDSTLLTGSSATDEDYGTCNLDTLGRLQVKVAPSAVDGVTPVSILDANSTGTTSVQAQALMTYLHVGNSEGSGQLQYVKIYDKATAATGSDTPKLRIPVTDKSSVSVNLGAYGVQFANGISVRCVEEAADNGTTAGGSNTCNVNFGYK